MTAGTSLSRGLAALVIGLAITSCRSVPTRVFMPEPIAPASLPGRYLGPPIRVATVHVPPELDRVEMLGEVAPGELRIDDLDHWAAPLGLLARQTLTADLTARLPAGRVIFPDLAAPAGASSLDVDILAFGAGKSGARLEVSWRLTSPAYPQGLAAAAVLEDHEPRAAPADMARAWSSLLAQLADRICAELASADR